MEQKIAKYIGLKWLTKKIIHAIVRNDFCWELLNSSFIRTADYARWLRINKGSERFSELIKNAINDICPDFVVRHGPFKGMKYPETKSFCYALFPKLVGSYEREIQHIIDEACSQKYTEVINVGCEEGYYAIGFAMRIPEAKIYAYDINLDALRVCREAAKLNNVDRRVIIGSFCNSETIRSISLTGKGLIISDCEGYEASLFSDEIIPTLEHYDLLVELHDCLDINISSIIRARFERTHEIIVIESIDDIKKAQTYRYEELEKYNLEERKLLLREGRKAIMQWFYMKSLKK